MAYTLGGIDLGTVVSEKPEKVANLDEMPTPLNDSDQAWAMDNTGAIQKWIIRGAFSETTLANLQTKVQDLYGLINGMQSTIVYGSETLGNKNVKVRRISGERREGYPLYFVYNIELIECSTAI